MPACFTFDSGTLDKGVLGSFRKVYILRSSPSGNWVVAVVSAKYIICIKIGISVLRYRALGDLFSTDDFGCFALRPSRRFRFVSFYPG